MTELSNISNSEVVQFIGAQVVKKASDDPGGISKLLRQTKKGIAPVRSWVFGARGATNPGQTGKKVVCCVSPGGLQAGIQKKRAARLTARSSSQTGPKRLEALIEGWAVQECRPKNDPRQCNRNAGPGADFAVSLPN